MGGNKGCSVKETSRELKIRHRSLSLSPHRQGKKKYQKRTHVWVFVCFCLFFLVMIARAQGTRGMWQQASERKYVLLTVISMRPAAAPPTVMSKKQTGLAIFACEKDVCGGEKERARKNETQRQQSVGTSAWGCTYDVVTRREFNPLFLVQKFRVTMTLFCWPLFLCCDLAGLI